MDEDEDRARLKKASRDVRKTLKAFWDERAKRGNEAIAYTPAERHMFTEVLSILLANFRLLGDETVQLSRRVGGRLDALEFTSSALAERSGVDVKRPRIRVPCRSERVA